MLKMNTFLLASFILLQMSALQAADSGNSKASLREDVAQKEVDSNATEEEEDTEDDEEQSQSKTEAVIVLPPRQTQDVFIRRREYVPPPPTYLTQPEVRDLKGQSHKKIYQSLEANTELDPVWEAGPNYDDPGNFIWGNEYDNTDNYTDE